MTEAEPASAQARRKHEHDVPGERDIVNRDGGRNAPSGGNVYSVSQPDAPHMYKITATRTNTAQSIAISENPPQPSQPSHPGLKHAASTPNIGNNWYSSSAPEEIPPIPTRNPSRPATPVKQPTTWMNPLEMHAVKGPPPSLLSSSKSPLAQFELRQGLFSEPASMFGDDDDEEHSSQPHQMNRPSPIGEGYESPQNSERSANKPISPPRSIGAYEEADYPALGRPTLPWDENYRPSSRGSQRNVPTTLKEVQNWDMSYYCPPSPVSNPRGSEEKSGSILMDLLGEPIQTVGARRDTMASMASIAPRRRSVAMQVEGLGVGMGIGIGRSYTDDPVQRARASNATANVNADADALQARVRPPPLHIDTRPRTPDRAGTYPPAPFITNQQTQSPLGQSPQSPYRAPRNRNGPPPAAVGARGRPGRPNTKGIHRPTFNEYEIQLQLHSRSQPHSRHPSQSGSDGERPPSPDSPLIPLTGPLASPRFPPVESQLAPPPLKGPAAASRYRTRDPSPLGGSPVERDEPESPILAVPRLGTRNVPTPDSSDWPLPSPDGSALEHPFRTDSPFLRNESPLSALQMQTPPRVLPGLNSRSDSPFGIRSFNFSRPMTPTSSSQHSQSPWQEHPQPHPLRDVMVPKRSETTPISPQYRDPDLSPSPGQLPPPRANTVNSRGLRSPAIVGDDFGGGFI